MSSVDVIVPCYRYGRYLRQCVNSVLRQTGVSVRVLIIDDASPDDSALVARVVADEDSRVTFVAHAENRGHISTYNEGLDWIAADYMLLLSADDYLEPGALERAARILDADPGAVMAFGKARELYDDGSEATPKTGVSVFDQAHFVVVSGEDFIAISGVRNMVCSPTAVVRTSTLKRAGGYKSELPHSGDMEMWLRLATYGRVAFIGECQAVYRRHRANMSLGYNYLRDLRQRADAARSFLKDCGYRLPNSVRGVFALNRLLSHEATALGHCAFAVGDQPMARQLAREARELDPWVRGSAAYLKLIAKLALGPSLFGYGKAVLRTVRL